MQTTANAREQMIEQQVRAWDVLDERVLDVMRRVPRELFVPQAQRYLAYADAEVPLPRGQHMLRPSVAGRLLQALLPPDMRAFREAFVFIAVALVLLLRPQGLIPAVGLRERI